MYYLCHAPLSKPFFLNDNETPDKKRSVFLLGLELSMVYSSRSTQQKNFLCIVYALYENDRLENTYNPEYS